MPPASTQPTDPPTVSAATGGRKRKLASVSEAPTATEVVPPPAASTASEVVPEPDAPTDVAAGLMLSKEEKEELGMGEGEALSTTPVATKARKPRKKSGAASSDVSSVAPSTTVGTDKKKRVRKNVNKTRTPSSYVLFSMMHRKTVIEETPNLTLGEVSKLCGSMWKTLSAGDKAPWIEKAEEMKTQRKLEIAEQTANDPPKKKRKPSSYLLFAMEHRKVVLEKTPGMSIGDVSKECGAAWKSLPGDVKQAWKDKATALKCES